MKIDLKGEKEAVSVYLSVFDIANFDKTYTERIIDRKIDSNNPTIDADLFAIRDLIIEG